MALSPQNTAAPGALALPHVVIIGGGFGGLTAAQSLADAAVTVTLIDRTNHHLFQPLLYQVAMAGLSPAEIASPIRSILRKQENVQVLMETVTSVDLAQKRVITREGEHAYDFVILATGGKTNYFGHDEWEQYAPGLKNLDDAIDIRKRVLVAFEEAEKESDEAKRRALMTFVVVGGGPTGVEVAGAIGELTRHVLARDFRSIQPETAEILLVEAGPAILPSFPVELQNNAVEQLKRLGVQVLLGTQVTHIDAQGVRLGTHDIEARTVIWGAGVAATELTQTLGTALDRGGRVILQNDLTLPGHPEAYAIGDMTHFEQDGKPLPGVSPVAMQMARRAADNIQRTIAHESRLPFVYKDKGSMATIGRNAAVAHVGNTKLTGFIAWLAWLFIHVFYLIGFRNRVAAILNWAWSYFTYQRGARLITGSAIAPSPQQSEISQPPERV